MSAIVTSSNTRFKERERERENFAWQHVQSFGNWCHTYIYTCASNVITLYHFNNNYKWQVQQLFWQWKPQHSHTNNVCVCGFNYVRQTERGHMSTSLDTCVGKSIWVNLVVLLFVFHDFVVKQTTATTTDYLCNLDINHFHHQTKHRTSLQK